MEKRGPVDALLALFGWALIGFGVATWAVALTIFDPALSAMADFSVHVDADDRDTLAQYMASLPWMSILVAVAGVLLMLRRSRLRGRLVWSVLVGWLVADVVLGRLDVAGPVAALVAGAVVAAIVVGVTIVGGRRPGLPIDRPYAIVYSGVLVVSAYLAAPPPLSSFEPHYPAGLTGTALAVAAALLLAAVVTTVSAPATVSPRHASVVVGVAGLLVVGGVLVRAGLVGDMFASYRLTWWAPYLVVGAVPVGLALCADAISRRRLPGLALLAVLAPACGLVAMFVADLAVMIAVYLAMDFFADSDALVGWAYTFGWLFSGALLGAMALVPQLVRRRPPPVANAIAPPLALAPVPPSG